MTGDVYISNHDIASHFLDGNEWGKGRGEARIESNTFREVFEKKRFFSFFPSNFSAEKIRKGILFSMYGAVNGETRELDGRG